MEDIAAELKNIIPNYKEDKEINNENYLLSYHSLITENIRSNNKKITRNSLGMIIVLTVYFLLFFKGPDALNFESYFGIQDPGIIFNFLPVVFSFLYLQNITIWNNNINLIPLFENLSKKMFNLGEMTDTVNVIKPFSLLHHILNYQYENKRVIGILKIPTGIAFLIILFSPIILDIIFLILLLYNNYLEIIPVVCFSILLILTITTVVQALNSHKN
ncbi:hypothetical protein G3I01_06360 [Gramella sp. MT6]|uniref:hypothetical protein n=1 Tax=Gramella sp. MT6 TaxID=2705471 RepID=UPI001C5D73F3|nr:hypothetical protein [Gramella sp. MT6]QYA25149.1 hypothetical protein G3I01_06360 [Gramella sp. MT6]